MSAVRRRLERALKAHWHDSLVREPAAHVWVLNLYRAGERHPETVDDYFPTRLAPWPWLAEALVAHRRDEQRHAGMFAAAIRSLGGVVREDLRDFDVFNEVIRACTPLGGFRPTDPGDAADRRRALAHFLAHAHFLETRVARSLEMHHEACERAGVTVVARVVGAVLRDEQRHARYTREAVGALLPRREAAALLSLHQRAEARANLLFSARQVRTYLRAYGRGAGPATRGLYRGCAALQHTLGTR